MVSCVGRGCVFKICAKTHVAVRGTEALGRVASRLLSRPEVGGRGVGKRVEGVCAPRASPSGLGGTPGQ